MPPPTPPSRGRSTGRRGWITAALVAVGILARLSIFTWSAPWTPHQADEHILPLDALALWEGITPREVGWPASTTRLVLSAGSAVLWFVDEGRGAWAHRHEPDLALQSVTMWIGQHYVDPAPLYKLGRWTSIITGVLYVVATAWALGQWAGPAGAAIGTLAAAIGPLQVVYSQFCLADITGLLFATWLAGLAANPTPRRVVGMAALAGLAASSKFHFGLWLLTPLLSVWLHPSMARERKWRAVLVTLVMAAWVIVTFVPWFWVNPLLALKEFAGVVLVKVGHGASPRRIIANTGVIFGGLGAIVWVGGLVAAATVDRREFRRVLPLFVPLALGTLALITSETVFDRYGLFLLPGLTVLAALGWDARLTTGSAGVRAAAAALAGVSVVWTLTSLVQAERVAGEVDVDVVAREWILGHVARGSRVAIHDEDNAFLPRAAVQLHACVDHLGTLDAYREKWLTEGITSAVDRAQPMRSMVLNDETYLAYWCHRELDVQPDAGYIVVPYHNGPRFGTFPEADVVREFRTGNAAITGGVDVLVMNRPIDVGKPPAQIFRTARGQRVLYQR
jgi:hypothetical protein